MRSPGVEIRDALVQHSLKVALVEDDHFVETVPTAGKPPSIGRSSC